MNKSICLACWIVCLTAGHLVMCVPVCGRELDATAEEELLAQRILYLSSALDVPEQAQAETLQKADKSLEKLTQTRMRGAVDPLDWLVLGKDEQVLLISRRSYPVEGNWSVSVYKSVCLSHLHTLGLSHITAVSLNSQEGVPQDPVLGPPRCVLTKCQVRIVLVLSVNRLREGAPEVRFLIARGQLMQLTKGEFRVRGSGGHSLNSD